MLLFLYVQSDLSFDASESVNNSFEKSKSLDSLSKKKLTPKQLAKKQESEARRLERERIKQVRGKTFIYYFLHKHFTVCYILCFY